ncbi:MAG: TetR/AcrR family transcriptional regulator [Clostridia bacterium]|nr:TetR/AcrR family transcriptional regulator [Clostridia bacterium]
MNVKDNQRTRLSKKMFRTALLDLLEEKGGVEKISVRELCARAELNRSTFYAHYAEPREVLVRAEEEILDETAEYIRKIGAERTGGGKQFLTAFLRYIRENDRIFRVLLVTAADPAFKNRFMQISLLNLFEHLQVDMDAEKQQFIYSYLLNGSLGVITQWIRSDYACSVADIVELLFTLNGSAILPLVN